jgi:hypothetical protein
MLFTVQRHTMRFQSLCMNRSVAACDVATASASEREGVESGIDKLGIAAGGDAERAQVGAVKWLADVVLSGGGSGAAAWESFAGSTRANARVYQLPFPMQVRCGNGGRAQVLLFLGVYQEGLPRWAVCFL